LPDIEVVWKMLCCVEIAQTFQGDDKPVFMLLQNTFAP